MIHLDQVEKGKARKLNLKSISETLLFKKKLMIQKVRRLVRKKQTQKFKEIMKVIMRIQAFNMIASRRIARNNQKDLS